MHCLCLNNCKFICRRTDQKTERISNYCYRWDTSQTPSLCNCLKKNQDCADLYHEFKDKGYIFMRIKKNEMPGTKLMIFINESPYKSTYYTVPIKPKLTESNPQLYLCFFPGFSFFDLFFIPLSVSPEGTEAYLFVRQSNRPYVCL